MRVLFVRLILSLSFNVVAFYGRPVRSVKWRHRSSGRQVAVFD